MPDRRIALAWVIGVLFVGSLLDVWLYYRLGNGATISQAVLWLSRKAPAVPMTFGWICGHFFWPNPAGANPGPLAWEWRICAVAVVSMLVAGGPPETPLSDFLRECSVVPFSIGFLCGHILTPQTDIKRGSA